MTVDKHTPGFAEVYAVHRGDLYRALVLITGNRDLAVDAVDHGFSRWHRRLGRGGADPERQILRHALAWTRRRRRGGRAEIQGFRLPGAAPPAGGQPLVERFERLGGDDRALLTLRHYLGWDDAAVAAALRQDPGDVPSRLEAAEARLGPDAADLDGVLATHAAGFPEPLDRMESSRRRGAGQRVLTVLGLVLLGIAVVGGAAFGVTVLTGSDGAPAEAVSATTVAGGALSIDPTEVDWIEVPLGILQGEVAFITHGPAGFAALVHDYSRGDGQTLLMLSEDGLEWTGGITPQPSGDGWVGYLAATGDRYVTLGSSWGRAGGGEIPIVSTSTDGVAWESVELASDDSLEIDGMVIPLSTSAYGIVGDASGLTVFGSQYGEFDVMSIVEEALPPGASMEMGWTVEDDELVLMDSDGSVASRHSAADLGIDPLLLSLLGGGRPVVWTSKDATEWTREYPDLPTGQGFGQVASVGDATVAMIYGRFNPELWTTSGDGTWDHAALPATAVVAGVTTVSGRLVAYGSAGGRAAVWVSDDGTAWEPVGDQVALGGLTIDALFGSAGGVVALARGNPLAGIEPVVISVGDFEITVQGDGRLVVTDADGVTVADVYDDDLTPRDDGSVVIPDPETGEPLVTVSPAALDQAREQQLVGLVGAGSDAALGTSSTVLLSTDLEHWTAISLSDTIGDGFYPSSAAFDGATVVLTGWRETGPFDSTGPTPSVWVADLSGD